MGEISPGSKASGSFEMLIVSSSLKKPSVPKKKNLAKSALPSFISNIYKKIAD